MWSLLILALCSSLKEALPSPTTCRPDEQHYECIPICHGTCSAYLTKSYLYCKMACRSGCFCREGLYKTDDGRCVPASKCTVPNSPENTCGANAEYRECGSACPPTCADRGKNKVCTTQCVSGCFCKKGFVKNDKEVCVRPQECQQDTCGANAEYRDCGRACSPTCADRGGKKKKCSLECVSGCFCKKGFVKNDLEVCVRPQDCEQNTCGKNEEYLRCGSACPTTCANLGKNVICTTQCVPGCFCTKGLVRNDQGKCVPPKECPQKKCPKNEMYSDCVNPCNDCQTRGKCNFLVCNKGCDCRKGYYRDFKGRCILARRCPQVDPTPTPACRKNEEYYRCKPTCRNTCENYQAVRHICSRICIQGCACTKGFVRRSDGKCVKPEKCNKSPPSTKPTKTSPPKCGKDEQYYKCVPNCNESCDNYNLVLPCPYYCKPGCFCKEGLVKNRDGKCVKPSECPSTNTTSTGSPPIQCSIPMCGVGCRVDYTNKPCPICSCTSVSPSTNSVCMQPKDSGPCFAIFPRFFYNQKTGQCEKFTFGGCKGNKNNFEKKEDCERTCGTGLTPSPPKCGKDEEYYGCIPNCHNTCETYNQKGPCPLYCKSGCFCKKGMVKNKDGKCVKPSKCPSSNPPSTASPPSSNHVCQQPKKVGPCRALMPRFFYNQETRQCEKFNYGGCQGNENNFKTKEECESNCGSATPTPTPTCGPDEQYYQCIPNCHNTCATYNKTNIACPDSCGPGCFCKEGMVKNDDGTCVSPSQCNALQPTDGYEECGEDEEYYDYCAPKCTGTCQAYNNPGIYHCPLCKPGCWCSQGLVKTSDGRCVTPDQCNVQSSTDGTPTPAVPPDSCREDEEYLSCGSACPVTCTTLRRTDFACIAQCVSGCFCKEGLVRNDQGDCVNSEDCPQNTCGEDEEYLDCGSACPDSCSNLGKDQVCTAQCVAGCFCKDGLVRNEYGECVETEDCPQNKCGEDEEYTDCGTACPPTCSNVGKDQVCTDQCVRGCFCREGLIRNDKDKCVEPEECPQISPKGCGEDEKYYDCAPSCGGTCDTYNKTAVILCLPCSPGCWCNEGLVKNDDGKCVRPEQCDVPKDTCGEDEEYLDCGTACPDSCSNLGQDQVCTAQCVAGCFCKDGLVRNEYGECVEAEDCPQNKCDEDEEYMDCGTDCALTCPNVAKSQVCTDQCVRGCFCREGLVRNDKDECVEPYECPQTGECSGENEEIMPCAKPKWCNTCGIRGNCKLKECKAGCDCKSGYYRDDNEVCIPQDQCPRDTTASPSSSNPVCQQPKKVGPCKALIPRFFYNQETRQCEQFNYGGCQGNENNFKTKEECESKFCSE